MLQDFKKSRSQLGHLLRFHVSFAKWRHQQDTAINPKHVHHTLTPGSARLDYGDSTYWTLRYKEKSTEPFLGGTCDIFQ